MAEFNIGNAITTTNKQEDFTVPVVALEGALDQKETEYQNTLFTQWLGYYKTIPEYKTAINGFATWIVGKGWTADNRVTAILENITGWGEDNFLNILWNMIVIKKVGGDSFAEIIRNPETGTLLNLKPLDPANIKIIVNQKGIIIRYEQIHKTDKKALPKRFTPQQILHICNDRIGDEIHGTSITEGVEWVIKARNEALQDFRKVLHRNVNPLVIYEVEEDDKTRIAEFERKIQVMKKDFEALVVPTGSVKVTIPVVPLENPIEWIRYLENFFYQALGVPKVILGGQTETEGDAKVSYLTFEQVYTREITELKADLWNQLAIRVEFGTPVSLKEPVQDNEIKNTSQVGFQSNDTTAGVGE